MKNPAAVALGKIGGKVKSEAKAKSSAANGQKGGRPRIYLYAIQEYSADIEQWEYKSTSPDSREKMTETIKQLRKWAKDEGTGKRYRLTKVELA